MKQVTATYYCDRCGNEIPDCPPIPITDVHIEKKRFRFLRWNGRDGCYETTHLCKSCAESFNSWWRQENKKGDN